MICSVVASVNYAKASNVEGRSFKVAHSILSPRLPLFLFSYSKWCLEIKGGFTHLLYITCRICNKCICSISTGSSMSYVQWRNSCTPFHFCSLRYHFNCCMGGLLMSGRVRTMCFFSLCVVSLLSDRFASSALVWFSNFLKYLVFHLFISLSNVFIWRCSWILWFFTYQGAFRMDLRVLDWKR
jgi:hypothetical protein